MEPIGFPGLGIKFTISRVAFSFFNIDIYWYGIIIAFGVFLALLLALRNSDKFGINKNDVLDMIIITLPLAIVGARLYYVIFSWSDYKNNLLEVFNIRNGGLAIYGGVIAAVATTYIFCRKRKISILKLIDFTVPYLALGQSIGRWGNFVNQEAHGTETDLPWRMEIFDPAKMQRVAVHPTFLYESLWNFSLFLFLIWYRKSNKVQGQVFVLYLALYGLARFFIEGMRTDSLYIGALRVSQVLAGVFFIIFTLVFVRLSLKHNKSIIN